MALRGYPFHSANPNGLWLAGIKRYPSIMAIQLKTNDSGNIITKPVTGYVIAPVAEIAVLLAIQYADNPQDIDKEEKPQIQFVLTPQQCLEIAAAMTRRARILLGDQAASGEVLN